MKLLCTFVVTPLLCVHGLRASPEQAGSSAAAAEVVIDSIDLVVAAPDHVQFSVETHAVSRRSIRARRISFDGMHLGGVPVYLGTLVGPLDLKAGQDLLLPAIPLTIYFRDLDSLVPVERAVSEGQVEVEGRVRVEFDLNVFQKLAARQWDGRSALSIDQSIPVAVPGGALGRLTTLAALKAADVGLSLASSALGSLRHSQEAWKQALNEQYMPALILAESRYSLLTKDGRQIDMVQNGVGFRITSRKFALTSEMVAPWKFDPEICAMLQAHEASLVPESVELLVWPGDVPIEPGNARSLSRGLIRVVSVKQSEETIEIPATAGYERVRVSKRNSDRNLAMLEFIDEGDSGPVLPQTAMTAAAADSWERVAVFRFSGAGPPEVVYAAAHRAGNRLVLDTPVDESAFGSPVILPTGPIAMLQSETSGVFLNKLF